MSLLLSVISCGTVTDWPLFDGWVAELGMVSVLPLCVMVILSVE